MSADRGADPAARVATWIGGARWFAGKGIARPRVSIHDSALLPPATGQQLLLVDVEDAAGGLDSGPIRSVVPLDRATGADSAATAAFAGWVVDLATGGGEVAAERGRFIGHPVGAAPRPAGVPGERSSAAAGADGWQAATVTPLGADASNTSLCVAGPGGVVVLKLMRRCRCGIHPEIECGRFFAESTDWRETPRLLGWMEYLPGDGAAADASVAIATVHAFEPGCRSVWEHLLPPATADGGVGPEIESMTRVASRLGAVTARMHAALASRDDLPDFAPRPATAAARQALATRLAHQARDLLGRSVAQAAKLPAVAARLERLGGGIERIVAALGAVSVAGTSAADIRLHGDYHLGQVLVDRSGQRLMPIDFEGEPGRSLAERRAVGSACKDVAGMCRSFDYLARCAAKAAGAPGGSGPWPDRRALEEAFLGSYRANARGGAWWPTDPNEEKILLDAFTLDKAVYELGYEIANRPDWVDVPLGAIEAWLDAAP
jgi:trehalose synthase-fused probable maltokinase